MIERIYMLDITYPDGSDADGWQPDAWQPGDPGTVSDYDFDGSPIQDSARFRWPAERRYLSRSGAVARAKLLRRWGAIVNVYESDPIVWAFKVPA